MRQGVEILFQRGSYGMLFNATSVLIIGSDFLVRWQHDLRPQETTFSVLVDLFLSDDEGKKGLSSAGRDLLVERKAMPNNVPNQIPEMEGILFLINDWILTPGALLAPTCKSHQISLVKLPEKTGNFLHLTLRSQCGTWKPHFSASKTGHSIPW